MSVKPYCYNLNQNQIFDGLRIKAENILTDQTIFLDLGCGKRKDIKDRVQSYGSQYIGIDISPEAPIVCDAHRICLKNSSVDIVYSAATLEHFSDPIIVVEDVFRVMKPGGLFIGLVAFLQPEHSPGSYFHMSEKGVIALLEKIGFIENKSTGANGKLAFEYLAYQMTYGMAPPFAGLAGFCAKLFTHLWKQAVWLKMKMKSKAGIINNTPITQLRNSKYNSIDTAIVFSGRKPY